MYNNHSCRCDDCRSGWAGYIRDYRAWRREYGALVTGWRDQLRKMNGENND
jgi:hypothetical protein